MCRSLGIADMRFFSATFILCVCMCVPLDFCSLQNLVVSKCSIWPTKSYLTLLLLEKKNLHVGSNDNFYFHNGRGWCICASFIYENAFTFPTYGIWKSIIQQGDWIPIVGFKCFENMTGIGSQQLLTHSFGHWNLFLIEKIYVGQHIGIVPSHFEKTPWDL